MAANEKRATLVDVARRAGVSKQTVSRVINNSKDVAASTRARVQKAIDYLGFRPSALARNLTTGRSYTVAVVGPSLFFLGTESYLGIAKAADEMGYTIVLKHLTHFDREHVEGLFNQLSDLRVDGILWAVPDKAGTREWLKAGLLGRLSTPIVFLLSKKRPNTHVIAFDNAECGRIATQHLIDIGRKRIAHISGPGDWWTAQERIKGWRGTLENAGLPAGDNLVEEGTWFADSGQTAMARLLDRRGKIDAVFAGNDRMALGALLEAHRRGIKVPDELAIVGVDNSPESSCYHPPLTTVRQDKRLLGELAMHQLIALVDQKTGTGIGAATRKRRGALSQTLIVRESAPAAMPRKARPSR